MNFTRFYSFSFCLVALLGCSHPSEENRLQFRDQSLFREAGGGSYQASLEHNLAILEGRDALSKNAVMRWQAAQNLGDLGALEASYQLLFEKSLSRFADENKDVRRECVIALAKLLRGNPEEGRTKNFLDQLSQRFILESHYEYTEHDPLVRHAMLDSLIYLGRPITDLESGQKFFHRDSRLVAAKIHELLTALYNGRHSVDERVEKGLLEKAYEGLAEVARVAPERAGQTRKKVAGEEYLAWWLDRIEEIPDL